MTVRSKLTVWRNARAGPLVAGEEWMRELSVDDRKQDEPPPPPVISGEPGRELERKLKRNPDDQDAKVDVGSDESMDASDPPASSQPGQSDEPVPSSGFPE
jgi:hypothetical protein